jgi:hypothetical protein
MGGSDQVASPETYSGRLAPPKDAVIGDAKLSTGTPGEWKQLESGCQSVRRCVWPFATPLSLHHLTAAS